MSLPVERYNRERQTGYERFRSNEGSQDWRAKAAQACQSVLRVAVAAARLEKARKGTAARRRGVKEVAQPRVDGEEIEMVGRERKRKRGQMVKVVSKLQGARQSGFEFRLVSVVTLMRCLTRGGETHLKAPCAAVIPRQPTEGWRGKHRPPPCPPNRPVTFV